MPPSDHQSQQRLQKPSLVLLAHQPTSLPDKPPVVEQFEWHFPLSLLSDYNRDRQTVAEAVKSLWEVIYGTIFYLNSIH